MLPTRVGTFHVGLFLLAPALGGCDLGACPLNIVAGVEVEVRDQVTNEFLATTPRGVVREGTFQDSLREGSNTGGVSPRIISLIGADERPGRYVVQVEAEGYLPWDTAGIRVNEGDCHVQTASFTAALDPAP